MKAGPARPAGLHHAEQLTAAFAQREHHPGAIRHSRSPGRGRFPGGRRSTTGRRRRGPPAERGSPAAAGYDASGWPRRGTGRCSPSSASAPSASRSQSTTAARAERLQDLRGQGAGQLGAVDGQFGRRLGQQRRGLGPGCLAPPSGRHAGPGGPGRRRPLAGRVGPRTAARPGPRRPSRPAGSRSPRTARQAVRRPRPTTGPSRSIRAPLAIATTDSPAAAARMRSSSRR